MNNNDVLRRVRYALSLNDNKVLKIWDFGGHKIQREDIPTLFTKEDEEGYQETSDEMLNAFLDGLIVLKRGVKNNVQQ